MPAAEVSLVGPELVLVVAALIVLLWDTWETGPALASAAPSPGVTWLALTAVVLALVWNSRGGGSTVGFAGMYIRDKMTRIVDVAALGTAGVAILLSPAYLTRVRLPAGEYYALLLLSTVGAMVMAASGTLATLFLGLEIL